MTTKEVTENKTSSPQVTGFEEESDYDLLEIMTWKESPETAKEAWAAFYRRHIEYIYAICVKACKGLGGEATAEDLAAEVFLRVYKTGARTFKAGPANSKDEMRKHVRAWLGQIANNLIRDAISDKVKGAVGLEMDELQNIPEQQTHECSEKAKKLAAVMESVLTEREMYILRCKFSWNDPEKDHNKMPAELVATLSVQLHTTPENIRQIACRAMKKLKNALIQ